MPFGGDAGCSPISCETGMTSAGYVRIDPAYQLRGWEGLPYALQDRVTGKVSFVPQTIFHTLRLCNGSLTADSPVGL